MMSSNLHDWAITSAHLDQIEYVNIIPKLTKQQLGNYIKEHIDELFGHVGYINTYSKNDTEEPNDIQQIIYGTFEGKDNPIDIEYYESLEEYLAIVKHITDAINLLPDENVVDQFCFKNDLTFTSISVLGSNIGEKTRKFDDDP